MLDGGGSFLVFFKVGGPCHFSPFPLPVGLVKPDHGRKKPPQAIPCKNTTDYLAFWTPSSVDLAVLVGFSPTFE